MRARLPRQPLRAGVAALLRAIQGRGPDVQAVVWRAVYEAASLGRGDLVPTMNYGYATATESSAQTGDDGADFGVNLYGAVARSLELSGKDVLEIGCGRGGGASFLFEQWRPRSLVGLDLARAAVERARRRYARAGLDFVVGRSDELPFADATFDVVISVESSHCYPSVPRFLNEVHRVLRTGGLLALADFRRLDATAHSANGSTQDLSSLREQLEGAGFRVVEEEDITSNVIRALELNTPALRKRIDQRLPRPFRRHALEFAAVEGSTIYRDFVERRLLYLRFVLQRV